MSIATEVIKGIATSPCQNFNNVLKFVFPGNHKQNFIYKFSKLSKVDFSGKCFRSDILQFSSVFVKILYRWPARSLIPSIFGISFEIP